MLGLAFGEIIFQGEGIYFRRDDPYVAWNEDRLKDVVYPEPVTEDKSSKFELIVVTSKRISLLSWTK